MTHLEKPYFSRHSRKSGNPVHLRFTALASLGPRYRALLCGTFPQGLISRLTVIPGLPALFAGRTRNPASGFGRATSWIPGSIADEASDGPGMTKLSGTFSQGLISRLTVIPGLPALFAGRTRNPASGFGRVTSWIPGSIADKASDGPGMTRVRLTGHVGPTEFRRGSSWAMQANFREASS